MQLGTDDYVANVESANSLRPSKSNSISRLIRSPTAISAVSPFMRCRAMLLNIAHVAHRNRVAKPGAYFNATVNVRERDIALDRIIAPADKPHADVRLQHGEQRLARIGFGR